MVVFTQSRHDGPNPRGRFAPNGLQPRTGLLPAPRFGVLVCHTEGPCPVTPQRCQRSRARLWASRWTRQGRAGRRGPQTYGAGAWLQPSSFSLPACPSSKAESEHLAALQPAAESDRVAGAGGDRKLREDRRPFCHVRRWTDTHSPAAPKRGTMRILRTNKLRNK